MPISTVVAHATLQRSKKKGPNGTVLFEVVFDSIHGRKKFLDATDGSDDLKVMITHTYRKEE